MINMFENQLYQSLMRLFTRTVIFRFYLILTIVLLCLFYIYSHLDSNNKSVQSKLAFYPIDWEWSSYSNDKCLFIGQIISNTFTHRVAILIPFRDRFTELQEIIPHLNKFLNHQNVLHTFFVINQVDSLRFNRGALLNVGVLDSLESEVNGIVVEDPLHINKFRCLKLPFTDYLALHDVDLLPIDPQLKYSIPPDSGPLHLIPFYLHPRYNFYNDYFGGVLLIRRTHFSLVDGMSNSFWGWGREDDEFRKRVNLRKLKIHYPAHISMGTRAFEHIHDDNRHKRDTRTYHDIRLKNLIKNPVGGLTTSHYNITKRRVILISGVPIVVINVRLHCDSPTCKDD